MPMKDYVSHVRFHRFMELRKITKWKDGAIFTTKHIGYVYTDMVTEERLQRYQLVPLSTSTLGYYINMLLPSEYPKDLYAPR